MPTSLQSTTKPSICLVYDRVTTKYGGAEFLLQQLLELFPEAPLFTSIYNQTQTPWIQSQRVRASFINRWSVVQKWYQLFAPILPLAFELLDVSHFDIVISISSAEAKGVLTKPHQLHLNYLFSPPKYLGKINKSYLRSYFFLQIPLMLSFAQIPLRYLRWWDQAAAARPDKIIPISKTMRKQLRGTYAKNVLPVIYPPVAIPAESDLQKVQSFTREQYFLSLSRLVWYKRVDLAVVAAVQTKSLLLIAGDGVMKKQLIRQAGRAGLVRKQGESIRDSMQRAVSEKKLVVFLHAVSEEEKMSLLTHAQATVQLGKEDFGIVAIEGLAHGTPAIIFSQSGAAEIVRDQQDGLILSRQSVAALSDAFLRSNQMIFSRSHLRKQAELVSTQMFKNKMKAIVYDVWKTHSTGVINYVT